MKSEGAMTTEEQLRRELDELRLWMERHLKNGQVEKRGQSPPHAGHAHPNGYIAVIVPDWDMRQRMENIQSALALPVSESRVEWRVTGEAKGFRSEAWTLHSLDCTDEDNAQRELAWRNASPHFRNFCIESRTFPAPSPWTVVPVEGGGKA